MGCLLFFYAVQSEIVKRFPNIFKGGDKPLKTGSTSERIVSKLSWQIEAYKIAEKGIFNREGLTPIQSVRKTNIYEIMLYTSLMIADNKLQAERMELEYKKKK